MPSLQNLQRVLYLQLSKATAGTNNVFNTYLYGRNSLPLTAVCTVHLKIRPYKRRLGERPAL